MAPPKDIARSYPKRGISADLGFRSEPTFCSDGAIELVGYGSGGGPFINYSLNKTFSAFTVASWVLIDGNSLYNYFMAAGGSGSFGGMVHLGWINGTTNPQLRLQDGKRSIAYIPSETFPEVVGRWCHVACTINSAGDSVKMYVNGVEATGLTQPTSGNEIEMPGSDGSSVAHFNIGSFQFSAGQQVNGIGGKMANFGLYDAELTQDQIIQLMRGNDFATCSAVATPAVFFELFENNTDSTGNAGTILNTGTPYYGYAYAQLPRGLDLTRGAAQARLETGRCVDFDGSADGLKSTATLNVNTSGAKATLACWVNPDGSTSGNKTIVSNAIDTNNNQFTIYQNGTSYAVSAVYASGFTKVNHFADSQVKVGNWTFLCAVWDFDTTSLTFYVNGGSFTDTPSTAIGSTNGVFEIGCRDPAGSKSQLFDGQIASVKLFDTTLTAAQVRELYHNPEQVLPTGVSASNLRRYYPLSDYNDTGGTGGRYFQDMGIDGKPALDQGSSEMAFAQAVPCPQLGLQQSASRIYWDDNTAEKLSATIAAFDSDFTIAFWWFRGITSDADVWLEVQTPGTSQLYYDGTQVVYYSSTAGAFYTGVSCALGEWSHIGITSAGVYKNGVLSTTSFTLDWSNTNYRIFGRHSTGLACNGICSNMGFWSNDLSTAEMLELYNQGPDYDPRNDTGNYASSATLTNLWFMDGLTTIKDRKGSNDLTVIGEPILASMPENASGSTIVGNFSMKRTGGSVWNPTGTPAGSLVKSAIISNDGSLSPDPSKGGYSFSAFIRLEQASGSSPWFPMVFSGTNYLTASKRFHLNFGDTSVAANAPGISISDGSSSRDYNWPSVLSNPEEWHQLAFTIDYSTSPNTTFKLYLDGALVSTQATHVHSAFDPGDIIVGSYTSANGNFPGAIACFKMYQTKLSDNEIKQVYRSDLRLIKGLQNV